MLRFSGLGSVSRLAVCIGRVGLVVLATQGFLARDLVAKEEPGRNVHERQITQAITSLLRTDHLTKHALDDEISERCLTAFIKSLDPWKAYFNKSDIEEFNKNRDDLDDFIRDGNIDFAYRVHEKYLERIDQRMKWVQEWLAADHDFTVEEDLVIDAESADFARDDEEGREFWRKRIKYDLLNLKAEAATKAKHAEENPDATMEDAPAEDPKEKLARRYRSFAKFKRQTDHDELLETYLNALLAGYDPHSSYMSPSTLENFEIQMRLNLQGIGAELRFEDGYTVVNKIVEGGAASRDARLKVMDKIVGVGQGESGEIVDVVDLRLNDVVKMIRGQAGTIVRLQVQSAAPAESKIYNITRAKIELAESEARSRVIEQERDGKAYKIGVIDLPTFYMDMEAARKGAPNFKSTTRDVSRLLKQFRDDRVDAVIVDLRRNPGGALPESISLTGLFIDQGPIVQVKDRDGRITPYPDEAGVEWDGPLVVLTSKLSASASEIFAGAIQDYRRGIVIGDHSTHGKGTVQSLIDLGERLFRGRRNPPTLGALKVTIQQFYRPGGDSTQNRGVVSDIELPSLTNVWEGISETDLDFAMKFDHVDALPFDATNDVNEPLIKELSTLSETRRRNAEGFQREDRNIARYLEVKQRKSVTLNESKFLAERAALNAETDQEKKIESLQESSAQIFDDSDYYNQEALAITVDLLRHSSLAQK